MKELALDMFKFIFGGGIFKTMQSVLTENPSSSGSEWYGTWKLIANIYETFVLPIGLGLMIIWFLVAFIQKATSEQMNFDQLFLLGVKLIASAFLLEKGMEIMAELWGLGIALMNDVMGGNTLSDGAVSNETLAPLWKELSGKDWGDGTNPGLPGFWVAVGMCLKLFFPWIVSMILSGVAMFIAYSRMFEMMLRVAAAPIALSDFFSEGLHSNAWRYIKTFLAICLQGFCILLIGRIYTQVSGGLITGNFMNAVVQYLVVSFAAIALMFKSLSFCKELVGAH